jgi:hypothetical protein
VVSASTVVDCVGGKEMLKHVIIRMWRRDSDRFVCEQLHMFSLLILTNLSHWFLLTVRVSSLTGEGLIHSLTLNNTINIKYKNACGPADPTNEGKKICMVICQKILQSKGYLVFSKFGWPFHASLPSLDEKVLHVGSTKNSAFFPLWHRYQTMKTHVPINFPSSLLSIHPLSLQTNKALGSCSLCWGMFLCYSKKIAHFLDQRNVVNVFY